MTEEQAKALKVGDKVRYADGEEEWLTFGKEYVIQGHDNEGDAYVCDDDGDRVFICGSFLREFESAEAQTPNYRIEIVSTSTDFDGTGMVHISAYVNDDLLGHLRDIEAEQGREAKRKAIREQIAKLEAELEAI